MNTVKTVPCTCPNCKKVLDMAMAIDGSGAIPIEGDITVCSGCTTVLYVNKELTLSLLPKEEYDELPTDLKEEINIVIEGLKKIN